MICTRRLVSAFLGAVLFSASVPALPQDTDTSGCARVWRELPYFCNGASKAWNEGRWDLYLSGVTYHGHTTYTAQKRATLNDNAWGTGFGRRYEEPGGNRTHLLYALVFEDSHYKPEWLAGYAWLTYWRPSPASDLRVGAGFTAFITTRADYDHYLAPVPGIAPAAEIKMDRVSIMAAYIPRLSVHKGNGDVLFMFARISF
jgi:lipid IVA palmitoyltransferase